MKKEQLLLRDEIYDIIEGSFVSSMDFDALTPETLDNLQEKLSDFITERVLGLVKPNKSRSTPMEKEVGDSLISAYEFAYADGYNERNKEINKDIQEIIL